jgi:hypothetical protein
MLTHYHIHTTHDPNTPDYPDPGSKSIYLTGCAQLLNSSNQNKEYKIEHYYEKYVDCERCKTWLSWLHKPLAESS